MQLAPILAGVPVLDQDLNLMQNAQFEAVREQLRGRVASGWLDTIESEPIRDTNTGSIKNNLYTVDGKDTLFIKGRQRLIIDGMPLYLEHCAGGATEDGDLSNPYSSVAMESLPAHNFQPANGVTTRLGTRVDLVILEAFRKEITTPASTDVADRRIAGLADNGKIFPSGCTQPMASTPLIDNDIIDPAVGGETSRRVQLQHRLRVIKDVDVYGNVHPLDQDIKAWPAHKRDVSDGVATSAYNFVKSETDPGLWVAGDGTGTAKTALGTFDGLAYAIPVAFVGRRNSDGFSLENLNGSTGRPDDRTADIHYTDVIDLRQNVAMDNNIDKQDLFEKTMVKVINSDLRTVHEEWLKNADGNPEFNRTGIIGSQLLRVEGIAGLGVHNAFQQTMQLQHNRLASNGVDTDVDGARNYFSDIGGEQAIVGIIPVANASGVGSSHSFYNYNHNTKVVTLNAGNLRSNDGISPYRTKVSVRQPDVTWGAAPHAPVNGIWENLGADTATFTISEESVVVAAGAVGAIPVGQIVTAPNGVSCEVLSNNGSLRLSFSSGNMPNVGEYTYLASGDTHTVEVTSITTESLGTNIHSSAPILMVSYVNFTPGSGFINRVPRHGVDGIVASQFIVDGTHVLPNQGKDFIPYGEASDETGLGVDPKSRTSHVMGFYYRGNASDITTVPSMSTSANVSDGTVTKNFFISNNNLYYRASVNGTHFTTPVLMLRGVSHVAANKNSGYTRVWFRKDGVDRFSIITMVDGSITLAPPTNAQVLVMYEAMADQLDRSLLGTTGWNTELYYDGGYDFASSEGTGSSRDGRFDEFVAGNGYITEGNHPYQVSRVGFSVLGGLQQLTGDATFDEYRTRELAYSRYVATDVAVDHDSTNRIADLPVSINNHSEAYAFYAPQPKGNLSIGEAAGKVLGYKATMTRATNKTQQVYFVVTGGRDVREDTDAMAKVMVPVGRPTLK